MSKETSDDPTIPAVSGENTAGGDGVVGTGSRGVVGLSTDYQGVYGHSDTNAGVVGEATAFPAVHGVSHGEHNGGLSGTNDSGGGFGVIGVAQHGDGIGVSGESQHIGVRGTGRQGDVDGLLTTAGRSGYAMSVGDRLAALGAVIGKALTPLTAGTGHVLVLVSLG